MKQLSLNLATGVCVALLPFSLGLWIRANFVSDQVWLGRTFVFAMHGQVIAMNDVDDIRHAQSRVGPGPEESEVPFWSWGRVRLNFPSPELEAWRNGIYRLMVPLWMPVLLAAPLPVARLLRYWRRRRGVIPDRRCVCGYDLRATPERCPECGAVADPAKY